MRDSIKEASASHYLILSDTEGVPIRFRFFFPPNLPQAAARDAVAVKVEIEGADGTSYSPEKIDRSRPYQLALPHLAVAGHLEAWCGGKLSGFIQLNRGQLRILLNALRGEPTFLWVNQPEKAIEWAGNDLVGVSEHIKAPDGDTSTPEENSLPQASNNVPSPDSNSAPPLRPQSATTRELDEGIEPMAVDGSADFLAISLPSREHTLYPEALDLLKGNDFLLEPSNRKWWCRDRHKVLNFLAEHLEQLEKKFHARFTENFRHNTRKIREARISCRASENNGAYFVHTSLDAGKFDVKDIQKNIAVGKNYVETKNRVFLLSPQKLKKLEYLQRSLAGNHSQALMVRSAHRIEPNELADTDQLIESLSDRYQTPEKWKKRSGALRNLSRLKTPPISKELETCLRPYQMVGVAWLYHLYRNGLGGILADEMGLGKTIQALALLTALAKRNASRQKPSTVRSPGETLKPTIFLVICPAGLLENWKREANRFTPEFRVFLHHRNERLSSAEDFENYELIVTSYATLIRDAELFRSLSFTCIIADEAQHIKNRQTRNAQSLCSLRSEGNFLLTGTPVENSLDDLISLFNFIMPGYLDRPSATLKVEERTWFDARLRQKAAPYILRRTKDAVAPELPPKIEQLVYCELNEKQRSKYIELKEKTQRSIFELEMSGASDGRLRVAAFSQLLRLRQFCCDPRLLEKGKEPIAYEPSDSAKMDSFFELLEEAIDGGHRILLFSQFVALLTLIRAELDKSGISYCYLDGKTKKRLAECDRFNNTPEIPIFLISLKAGGTGLNLTGADMVIHFDPWWNPAVEAQATDRAHRIGQSKVVTNIKLIAANTVEEKVIELQRSKSLLLEDIFTASQSANKKLNLEDLKELLE